MNVLTLPFPFKAGLIAKLGVAGGVGASKASALLARYGDDLRGIAHNTAGALKATPLGSEKSALAWLWGRGIVPFLKDGKMARELLGVSGKIVDFIAQMRTGKYLLLEAKETLTQKQILHSLSKFDDTLPALKTTLGRTGRGSMSL